jgi:hypothetical protein
MCGWSLRIALTLTLCSGAAAASAALWEDSCREYHNSTMWPHPLVEQDAQLVCGTWNQMVAAGWQRQNMVASYHFEEQTGQLTEAGRQKILVIITESPAQHRVVYVHRGLTPQETAARLHAVSQAVADLAAPGPYPPVLETGMSQDGVPAEMVDAVARKFVTGMPDPHLGASSGGGGGH